MSLLAIVHAFSAVDEYKEAIGVVGNITDNHLLKIVRTSADLTIAAPGFSLVAFAGTSLVTTRACHGGCGRGVEQPDVTDHMAASGGADKRCRNSQDRISEIQFTTSASTRFPCRLLAKCYDKVSALEIAFSFSLSFSMAPMMHEQGVVIGDKKQISCCLRAPFENIPFSTRIGKTNVTCTFKSCLL